MRLPFGYNVRNLIVRWRVTVLAIGAIGLVVAVLVVLAAMANGFRQALRATGSVENAVLTQRGSTGELTSGISFDNARAVMVDSRVARDDRGVPLASPEIFVVASLPRRTGPIANVSLRGVTDAAFTVRHGVRIVEGRRFTRGLPEIIVGRKVLARYAGVAVGQRLRMQRRDWTITGVFEANGGGFESEIWGDLDVLGPAFQRRGGYQSVTLRLRSPADVGAFHQDLTKNPRMQVQLIQERKYYDDQSAQVSAPLLALAVFVALVMGVGAVFGAMNTMYAIVASRTREIGTLRALGFSRASILLSFVIESTLLALAGGLLGCALAVPANGLSSAAGGANFAEVSFAFQVTPAAIAAGLGLALVIGVAGGLLPAWRASRVPITAALRS
ncbi:MAG: ABC transporter permease [Vicinamibacterales bacterium]